MENQIEVWAKLKKKDYYGIVIYLLLILLSSVSLSIAIFIFDFRNINSIELSLKTVFLKGIFIETSINSIYYIRKIYKKSISNQIEIVNEYLDLSSFGVILYFISRPIFGVLFYLFASVLFLDFIHSIVPDFSNVNGSLNPWITILAIYVGHTTGDIIDLFNDKANRIFRATN